MTKPQEESLESLLDATADPEDFAATLSRIASEKAEHLRSNWQDEPRAKAWERVADAYDVAALRCSKAGNPYS